MMYKGKTLFQGTISGNGNLPAGYITISGNGTLPSGYWFKNPTNWAVIIYVSAVSGTSPTLNINFGINSVFQWMYIPLPTITTVGYYIVEYINGDLIYTQLNTNGQIVQRAYLGKHNPMAGIYMTWTVGGTSPAFTVQIVIRQPKGEEDV